MVFGAAARPTPFRNVRFCLRLEEIADGWGPGVGYEMPNGLGGHARLMSVGLANYARELRRP